MTEPVPDLAVRDLVKEYTSEAGTLSILRGIQLKLGRGSALAITGPSGAGKSTLLYILGVLDNPTSGTVALLGQDPFQLAPPEQAAFRNRRVGFVFQDHHLLPQCNVLENVLIPTLPGAGVTPDSEQRARKLLDRVGLGQRLDHRPAQLSGGERQRVAVCRALINRPVLLLADEPTGNLDRRTAESVGSLLLELNQEEQTILVCVTHSQELAERFPDQRELLDGKLQKPA
jgi:lipoprotein-releasing system ATP-binding protein